MTDSTLSRERRKATVWIAATWLFITGMLAISLYFIIAVPVKSDPTLALGACGQFMVLRKDDGSLWLRVNGLRSYRVESLETLVCK